MAANRRRRGVHRHGRFDEHDGIVALDAGRAGAAAFGVEPMLDGG